MASSTAGLDEMPDGWIYMATYWGEHPNLPPAERSKIGGRLARYNVRTATAEDLGMPLPGDSFPMHATDIGPGDLPRPRVWAAPIWPMTSMASGRSMPVRCPATSPGTSASTLIDPKTGCCYGSEIHTRRIVGYDPAPQRFLPHQGDHSPASRPRQGGQALDPLLYPPSAAGRVDHLPDLRRGDVQVLPGRGAD